MTYPNLYLEGTCATFTQEQCERLFKGKRPISWNWLRRRIKSQIPQLYDALSLDLPTFYEGETYSTKTHYIFTYSATDYFLRKV